MQDAVVRLRVGGRLRGGQPLDQRGRHDQHVGGLLDRHVLLAVAVDVAGGVRVARAQVVRREGLRIGSVLDVVEDRRQQQLQVARAQLQDTRGTPGR